MDEGSDNPIVKRLTLLLAILGALASFTQPGASAQATRDASAIYAADHGAKCDGETDDAPAINAAVDAIRHSPDAPGGSWPIGRIGRLVLPRGHCVIRRTLNFSGLYGSGFVADFWGTLIDCRVKDGICIDMTGSGGTSLLGLNIHGSEAETPRFGLVLARKTESLKQGADHIVLDHPTLSGFYTVAPYYNRSSETTLVTAASFDNLQPHAFAAVFDGSNHFGVQSGFIDAKYPPDRFSSFNENSCTSCIFTVRGAGSVPLWIGGTSRLKFYNSYAGSTDVQGAPSVILWFGNGVPNDFTMLDLHMENRTLGAAIEIQGAPQVTIRGLVVEDPFPEQSGPLFRRGPGVEHVALEGAQLKLGMLDGNGAVWWDDPAAYRLSGQVYSADGTFVPPGAFSGTVCAKGGCVTR